MIINGLKLFVIAFFIFIVTDIFWLGLIAKNMYFEQYRAWLRVSEGQLQPIWWASVMVYLLFALSVVVFVLPLAKGSLLTAGFYGAFLGAVIYGVYDFTCVAIFQNWPVGMAFIDWAWGIFLCSWVSTLTAWIQGCLK